MEIENKIYDVLYDMNLLPQGELLNKNENISNLINSSMMFIQLMMNVEKVFHVDIPDDYLVIDKIGTISHFAKIIENLMQGGFKLVTE